MAPTPNLEVSVSIMNSLEKFSMTRIRTVIITFFKALSFLIPHECIFFKQTIEWLYYLTITLHKPSVVASQTQKTLNFLKSLGINQSFTARIFFGSTWTFFRSTWTRQYKIMCLTYSIMSCVKVHFFLFITK